MVRTITNLNGIGGCIPGEDLKPYDTVDTVLRVQYARETIEIEYTRRALRIPRRSTCVCDMMIWIPVGTLVRARQVVTLPHERRIKNVGLIPPCPFCYPIERVTKAMHDNDLSRRILISEKKAPLSYVVRKHSGRYLTAVFRHGAIRKVVQNRAVRGSVVLPMRTAKGVVRGIDVEETNPLRGLLCRAHTAVKQYLRSHDLYNPTSEPQPGGY